MENLSDINFPNDIHEDGVNSFEDLYTVMEDYNDNVTARPSSTVSFSSWTFSPISSTEGGQSDDQQDLSLADLPHSTNQQVSLPSRQPITFQEDSPQSTPDYHHHQQQAQQAPMTTTTVPSEYILPNNVTYHHSVNIQNFVGNYRVGTPTWKDIYAWDGTPTFPALTEMCDQSQFVQPDPLATLNTQSLELTRCSTPDYLMALSTLNKMDSPPKPNHSAAMNFSYSSSFDDSLSKSCSQYKQDSGYNSDLNVSPVIQFQNDNSGKMSHQPAYHLKQTSTPCPVMRLNNNMSHHFNKENVAPIHQRYVPQRIAMPMPGYTQNLPINDKPAGYILHPTPHTAVKQLQPTIQPYPLPMAVFNKPSMDKLHSIADKKPSTKTVTTKTVKTEKAKPALKRKLESTTDTKDNCPSSSSDIAKRRRHNEPLNNMALDVMQNWYDTHHENPYPTKTEKDMLARDGGISLSQVKSWFANKRNRSNNTKPKKQKQEMEGKLMEICHQLARDARKPNKDNAYYIQQLSSIMHHHPGM